MKSFPSSNPQPVRRDLIDGRSSRTGTAAPRKALLNDPRSTGGR
jgi:hypothetical protein